MNKDSIVNYNITFDNVQKLVDMLPVLQPMGKYLVVTCDNQGLLRKCFVDHGLLGFLHDQKHLCTDKEVLAVLNENMDHIKLISTNEETRDKEWKLFKTLSKNKYGSKCSCCNH